MTASVLSTKSDVTGAFVRVTAARAAVRQLMCRARLEETCAVMLGAFEGDDIRLRVPITYARSAADGLVTWSAELRLRIRLWRTALDTFFAEFSPATAQRMPSPSPRQHKPRKPTLDGLRTKAEAAAKLGISLRTLDEHVASGALRYVALGHGRKRVRRMFTDADLNDFIAAQTRKDSSCPSIASGARRSGTSISGGEVIGFTALQKRRRDAKPKK